MNSIHKSLWRSALTCPSKAWFEVRNPRGLDDAALFRMEQGREVGEFARRLFPEGVLVKGNETASAEEVTRDLCADNNVVTLFEPAFTHGRFAARADVLTRREGHWHLLEVKSSFSDTEKLEELIDDAAYTFTVLLGSGIEVSQVSLLLLSRKFRKGDPSESLFEFVDVTAKAQRRAQEWRGQAELITAAIDGETRPAAVLASACRKCEFFESKCLGAGLEHTVLDLPDLHHIKLRKLSAAGIVRLDEVPDYLQLNELQQRVKSAALNGIPFVSSGLGAALEAVNWPCHYLDFETVATVLPLFDGGACHEQVVTQFSIHHKELLEADARHSEYLADPSGNHERELTEALIQALGDSGTILVYSSFEKQRIEGLKKKFPDLAVQLDHILGRLLDLHRIVKEHVYHPEFRGSFSIKNVLPVLVPELSYEGLEIGNGDQAITMYARMARGEIRGPEAAAVKQALFAYCKLDTLAMVRLHEALSRRVVKTRVAGGE